MKANKDLTSLSQFVDKEYGIKGTKKRDEFEAKLEKDLKDIRFSTLQRIIKDGQKSIPNITS